MGLIPADHYAAMRAREAAGESDVFFPSRTPPDAAAAGTPPESARPSDTDCPDALEAHPVLPPRVRRRA